MPPVLSAKHAALDVKILSLLLAAALPVASRPAVWRSIFPASSSPARTKPGS